MDFAKHWNMKVTVIPVVICALGTVIKRLVQGQENLEIRGRIETIQTTEKSPGDLRRLIIQTPVKDHQPTLM